jgi:diacylglycerol kinase
MFINWQKLFKSFGYAIEGLVAMVKTENNARFHVLATIGILGLGVWQQISSTEWLWIALAIALVWAFEAMNTALEALTNLASPDVHPLAKKAKDTAAGAVLVVSIFAVIVAIVVLIL